MDRNANPSAADEGPSVIGSGIFVDGDIEANVELQIRGKVAGNVRCETLILGEHGEIRGNVVADRVRLSGLVDGAIDTADLAIEATARVQGDLTYSRIKMATGAVVQGRMSHVERGDSADSAPARTGPTPARKASAPPPKAQAAVYIE
jgi:cytoskeletal protein CcmA (bactofilin family)